MDVIKACTCAVCMEFFTDPRMLPCGHTYCQKCIELLLEGAKQKSAQCPECRCKNKQPAKGFTVNYGMLSMVDQVEASAGTRSIGTCNSCTKSASTTDLFNCTTCKDNSATASNTKFLVCAMCIAKAHKGHDYEELDVVLKKDIDEALRKAQLCRNAYSAKKDTVRGIASAVERFGNLLTEREAALDKIMNDLRSGNALTKPQLMDKVKESEKIEKELDEGECVTAIAALEECRRKLNKIPALRQQNINAPDDDASVLVLETSSDSTDPPPPRRRKMSIAEYRRLRNLDPPQASTSGTLQAHHSATADELCETSPVVVESDDEVVPWPLRRDTLGGKGPRTNRND